MANKIEMAPRSTSAIEGDKRLAFGRKPILSPERKAKFVEKYPKLGKLFFRETTQWLKNSIRPESNINMSGNKAWGLLDQRFSFEEKPRKDSWEKYRDDILRTGQEQQPVDSVDAQLGERRDKVDVETSSIESNEDEDEGQQREAKRIKVFKAKVVQLHSEGNKQLDVETSSIESNEDEGEQKVVERIQFEKGQPMIFNRVKSDEVSKNGDESKISSEEDSEDGETLVEDGESEISWEEEGAERVSEMGEKDKQRADARKFLEQYKLGGFNEIPLNELDEQGRMYVFLMPYYSKVVIDYWEELLGGEITEKERDEYEKNLATCKTVYEQSRAERDDLIAVMYEQGIQSIDTSEEGDNEEDEVQGETYSEGSDRGEEEVQLTEAQKIAVKYAQENKELSEVDQPQIGISEEKWVENMQKRIEEEEARRNAVIVGFKDFQNSLSGKFRRIKHEGRWYIKSNDEGYIEFMRQKGDFIKELNRIAYNMQTIKNMMFEVRDEPVRKAKVKFADDKFDIEYDDNSISSYEGRNNGGSFFSQRNVGSFELEGGEVFG